MSVRTDTGRARRQPSRAPAVRRVRARALAVGAALACALAPATHADAPALQLRAALAARPLSPLAAGLQPVGDVAGRVTVVNFWASWCRPCRTELSELERLEREIAPRGGRVVAISIDRERSRAERFVKQQRLKLAVYHDGAEGLASQLDLPALPCTYLLGWDGNVSQVFMGGGNDQVAALRRATTALLSQRPSAVTENPGGSQ